MRYFIYHLMKNRHSYLLFAVLFFLSCTGGNNTSENSEALAEENDQFPIHIFLEDILQKKKTDVSLSTIASEIRYVPLETTKNSLLRRSTGSIKYLGEKYIVYGSEEVLLFDQNGKFISRVADRGQGPQDIKEDVDYIIVDPVTNNFYVFTTGKVLKFDKMGKYIDHFRVEYDEKKFHSYQSGVFTHNNTMILSPSHRVVAFGETSYKVIEIDTLGRIINKYIDHSPKYVDKTKSRGGVSVSIPIYVFNNNVRFIEWGNDTIFSVTRDSMIPYAILDLGKNKMDINKLDNRGDTPLGEAIKNLTGHSVMSVQENENYIFLYFTENGLSRAGIYCLYDKKTKELKRLNNIFTNDLDGGAPLFPISITKNEIYVGLISPEILKELYLSKDYDEQKTKYGEHFEKAYRLAESIQEDDNPALVILKQKK